MLANTELNLSSPEKFASTEQKKIFLRKKMQEELDAINSYTEAILRETDPITISTFKELLKDENNHLGRLIRELARIDKQGMGVIQNGIEGSE